MLWARMCVGFRAPGDYETLNVENGLEWRVVEAREDD
jgi:hypothetical protein